MSDQLEFMREELSRRRFRDWNLTLEPGSDTQAHMVIVYVEADSYTGKPTKFRVVSRIDHTTDADRFHRDVTSALTQAWQHEFDEADQLDGKPINNPHEDPTRWHCSCGTLGPVRRPDTPWTCSGCGTTAKQPEESDVR